MELTKMWLNTQYIFRNYETASLNRGSIIDYKMKFTAEAVAKKHQTNFKMLSLKLKKYGMIHKFPLIQLGLAP